MRRINLAFILLLTMLVISSCSKSDDDAGASSSGVNGSVKMMIVASSPNMVCEVIAASQDGSEIETQYSTKWTDNATCEVWAKQSGELVYLGKQDVAFTSSDKKKGTVNIDGTGKLDASKPYEIIGLGCSWRRDGNELFYRTNLYRGDTFGLYFKTVSGQWSVETSSRVAGTAEILYVINKTDKPIKFRHRGFDAEKKWYYTHAEVSIDKGTIVNTEQEGDAVSEEGKVAVFTGKNAFKVYSYYIPNGNKIQNAQLIAEIDGKEVRSENRISSDITLQTDHAYGIFAVWDGKRLTLGDGGDEPVIHITSDASDADFTVVDVGTDETMTIKTTRGNMPKVGDILASGPTEKAPYGFLCRVDAVEEITTRAGDADADGVTAKIKKGLAYLDDVLPDVHLSKTVNIDDLVTDYAEDMEGNRLRMLNDDEYRWKFPEIKIPIYKWTNNDGKEAKETDYGMTKFDFRLNFMMDPKELTFFLDIDNAILGKWGVTYNFTSRVTLDADLAITYNFLNFKDRTLCSHVLKPIVIPASTVPIVITPKAELKFTASVEAALKTSVRLFDWKTRTDATMYYRFSNPNIPFFKLEKKESDNRFFIMDSPDMSIELGGNIDFTVHPVISFGVYGSNLVDNLGGGVRFEDRLQLNAGFKLGYTEKADEIMSGYDGYEVTDEASMEIGNVGEANVYLSYFNPLKRKTDEVSKAFYENDDLNWKGKLNLFYAGFKKVEAQLTKTGYITFTATKTNSLLPFTETDCGFCYAKESVSGHRWIPLSVNYMTVNPKYRNNPKMLESSSVKYDLPFKDLEPNTTYTVRPYVVADIITKEILILRGPAIRFKTDNKGQVNNTSIEDIPGMNLAPRHLKR